MLETKDGEEKNQDEVKTLQEVIMEFCSNTTIHGIRYFTEKRRHWTERLWWVIAFGLSVILCIVQIQNILVYWKEHAVTISFDEKPAHISEIPFPAVTVCVKPKAYLSKLNLTDSLDLIHLNMTKGNERHFLNLSKSSDFWKNQKYGKRCPEQSEALKLICDNISSGKISNFTDDSVYNRMRDIAPTEIFSTCNWKSSSCLKEFPFVYTKEGVCFTFNSLNSREIYTDNVTPTLLNVNTNTSASQWNLESGYQDSRTTNIYPHRIFNARPGGALNVDLKLSKQDLDFDCNHMKSIYRVFLHVPGEVPLMSRNVIQVAPLEMAEYAIKATLITTSDGLRGYTPNDRKCFFNSDRQLRFYKLYTKNNCESECLTNFTRQTCGCVRFFMPRDKETKICGGKMASCYAGVEQKMTREDIIDGIEDNAARLFLEQCNCLPSCTSLTYDVVDRSQTFNQIKASDSENESQLSIYFKTHEVITLRRREMYTISNFLAICGGLLGLFLGISVLSVIECIYYFTLRLFLSIYDWKLTRMMIFQRRTNHNTSTIKLHI